MSDDFEVIEYDEEETSKKNKKNKKEKKHTLTSEIIDSLASTNFKLLVFIFLAFLLVTSDVFADKVISRISPDAVDHHNLNSKGTMIAGLFLVLAYVVCDVIIKTNIV
jgi:hypothetical protein